MQRSCVYKRLSLSGEQVKVFPLDMHNLPNSKPRMLRVLSFSWKGIIFASRMCKPTSGLTCQCYWTSSSIDQFKKSKFEKCVVVKALFEMFMHALDTLGPFHSGLVFHLEGVVTCFWFLWRTIVGFHEPWSLWLL